MKRIAFNDQWHYRIWGVPGAGKQVVLPHDHSMSLPRSKDARSGSAGGFFQCENIVSAHAEGLVSRQITLLKQSAR